MVKRSAGELLMSDSKQTVMTMGLSHLPWANPHQWNWEAGKKDSAEEKGLPSPNIRQSTYEWGTQERKQALEKKREAKVRFMI